MKEYLLDDSCSFRALIFSRRITIDEEELITIREFC